MNSPRPAAEYWHLPPGPIHCITVDPSHTKPFCLHCRYDLQGLRVDDRCPECGEPVWVDVDQRVSSLVPAYARFETSFYAAVLALVMSFGCGPFGALVAAWALIQSVFAVRDRTSGIRPESIRNMPFVSLVIASIAMLVSLGSLILLFRAAL